MYNPKYNEQNYRYRKEKYKRVGVDFPVDYYNEVLLPAVEASGMTVSGFIKESVKDKLYNANNH